MLAGFSNTKLPGGCANLTTLSKIRCREEEQIVTNCINGG